MKQVIVNYYTKDDCLLCVDGLLLLQDLAKDYPFKLNIIDIYKSDELLEKYQLMIPVVEVDGEIIDYGDLSWLKLSDYLDSLYK